MRHVAIALILAFLACGGNKDTGAGRSVLRIGTDATYPPFETVNTNTGQPEGFDIDLITEICKINGWKPEFVITPFDGIIPGLTGGKYDVVISSMTITPQREAVVDFSNPYYLAGQSIAVPLDNTTIKGASDLVDKRVGVQLGTTGELMAQKIAGVKVFSFDNIGAAFIDMANGHLDAIMNDFPTTQAYIRAHGTAKTVGGLLSTEHYGIAVRKGDAALLKSINSALAKIKAGDTYRQLHMKWFDAEPASEAESSK
ncbi:MAG TPA: basic amino acid ABC transporter substrate-binding protein [Candidatus Acidoferrum sp.]|nr:basic amino acid ABC transporter substrate-binding protein [Candidatus Acidoferrum sp.]